MKAPTHLSLSKATSQSARHVQENGARHRRIGGGIEGLPPELISEVLGVVVTGKHKAVGRVLGAGSDNVGEALVAPRRGGREVLFINVPAKVAKEPLDKLQRHEKRLLFFVFSSYTSFFSFSSCRNLLKQTMRIPNEMMM